LLSSLLYASKAASSALSNENFSTRFTQVLGFTDHRYAPVVCSCWNSLVWKAWSCVFFVKR